MQHGDGCRPLPVVRTDEPEPALWALAREGDRDAFTSLYHCHADAVWRHGYRLTSSAAAAEDVLSATFLVAWRRRGDVRLVAGSARPWLLTVAANEARTEWRRAARARRLADRVGVAPAVDDPADGVVAALHGRQRARAVLDAVAALPASQREVVALCLVAEVPQADAALALGIPEVTLRSRLHRARTALRARLPEEVR
jgi:RNA polymerase sigma factor (sigma-70 family)